MSRWQIYEVTTDFDGVECYIKRGEIVRCGECKHYVGEGKYCQLDRHCTADDFCSRGEREGE